MLEYSVVGWVPIDMDICTAEDGSGGQWIRGLPRLVDACRVAQARIFEGKHVVFWLLDECIVGSRSLLNFMMGDAIHVTRHIILNVPLPEI